MTNGDPRTCFVVMPITVPTHLAERYGGRDDHFEKIYDTLIAPAVERAHLTPIGPARTSTENIQAAIINDLQGADLVLADLSALNPNVFLELGIRSALDEPVCLVSDGHDPLPFDSSTLFTHRYDPRPIYELNKEIERMATFISTTMTKSDGRNALWKFFGRASDVLPVAALNPADATLHQKIDRLADLVERRTMPAARVEQGGPMWARVIAVRDLVESALLEAGPGGLHGSKVRSICQSVFGEAFEDFLDGATLSARLVRMGLDIQTDSSGQFVLRPATV